MKICDVVLNSIWYDPRVRKQILEYKNNNIEVTCIGYKCERYNEENIKSIPCEYNIVSIPKEYMGYQKSYYRKLKREILAIKAIEKAIIDVKPDLIHANDLDALIPAYFASRKLKCKLVYDTHEVFLENNNIIHKKLLKLFYGVFEYWIIKRVDRVICVSNSAAEYFKNKYNITKPLVVTNCSLKKEMQVSNSGKNELFEVLNHGQFYEGRGYDLMLETAKHMISSKDILFVLRGFGVMEDELRHTAKINDLQNVEFRPRVKVEDLIPFASKSKVGIAITEPICLNFKLSVSNKLFEYAAAGLPVIMSDIPEHRYLNEKYHFGIILEKNTPEYLKKAIEKLYYDKDFYIQCSKNSFKMSEQLNWENEFLKLVDFEKHITGASN